MIHARHLDISLYSGNDAFQKRFKNNQRHCQENKFPSQKGEINKKGTKIKGGMSWEEFFEVI